MAYSEEFTGRKFNEDIYRNVNRLREPKRYDEAPEPARLENQYHGLGGSTGRNVVTIVQHKPQLRKRTQLDKKL